MVKTTESGQHYPQASDHLAVLSVFHLFDCSQNDCLHNFEINYCWATSSPKQEATVALTIHNQLPDDGYD